jgi:hypothetical protein
MIPYQGLAKKNIVKTKGGRNPFQKKNFVLFLNFIGE